MIAFFIGIVIGFIVDRFVVALLSVNWVGDEEDEDVNWYDWRDDR